MRLVKLFVCFLLLNEGENILKMIKIIRYNLNDESFWILIRNLGRENIIEVKFFIV